VSVIPITQIVRILHLQSSHGGVMDSNLRSETALDISSKFLLNPWVTPRTWSVFREL
jgi:hypothetical protein